MSESIDISGVDKAEVLAALYNASKPQGLGILHFDPSKMHPKTAAGYLEKNTYFDYLMGRVMKIDLSSDFLNPRLYDRDNGDNAARIALEDAGLI